MFELFVLVRIGIHSLLYFISNSDSESELYRKVLEYKIPKVTGASEQNPIWSMTSFG